MTPKDLIVLVDLYDEYLKSIQSRYPYKDLDEIGKEYASFNGFIFHLRNKISN
jgi:hypothetical protein